MHSSAGSLLLLVEDVHVTKPSLAAFVIASVPPLPVVMKYGGPGVAAKVK